MLNRVLAFFLLSSCLVISTIAQASRTAATQTKADLTNELTTLTTRIYNAGIEGDRKALETYIDDDFQEVDAIGVLHDKEWNLSNFLGKGIKLTYKIEEASVRGSDCMAILFYVWQVKQETMKADGKVDVFHARLRVTDTYIRRNDRWRLIASHRSRLPDN
jgi:hypothetical protein